MAKRKRKRQPRRYHYDDMDTGIMSREEHVAAELAGEVVTLNIQIVVTCRRPGNRGILLNTAPWRRGSDDPNDPGYVIQVARGEENADPWRLVVVRLGDKDKKWWTPIPTEVGEYRFRFRHDDRTVVVAVEVVDP